MYKLNNIPYTSSSSNEIDDLIRLGKLVTWQATLLKYSECLSVSNQFYTISEYIKVGFYPKKNEFIFYLINI